MASFDTQDFGFDEPPPRPATPPVRKGFLLVLALLCLAALVVYGVPYVAERTSYSWEAGRARADSEALAKLDKAGIVDRASYLFRMASSAVSPAVVNVHSFRLRRGGDGFQGLPLGGNRWSPRLQDAELGSGVIINKAKGYIVTNNHVVNNADRIFVRHGAGEDVPARLVGADTKTDLAVLQVNAALQVQAEWGDSDHLDIGSWVLAIGSPLGFDHSVTAGIVSATERHDVQLSEYESFIQTDAAINPGNSGGPLINLAGQVVGINTALISQSGGYEGIGLAIPSALARRVVEGLIKEGKVVRGYLGVVMRPLNQQLAKELKIPDSQGALIAAVHPDSPAERAGLKRGDVVVKIGERAVADFKSLRNLTAGLDVGAVVPLTYYRDGAAQTTSVTIAELPPAPEILAALGFNVHERAAAGEGGGRYLEIDHVVAGGPAFKAGLRPGMRITAIGPRKEPVSTLGDFENAVRKVGADRGVSLHVQSADGRSWVFQIGTAMNGRGGGQP
jgi:serine protease Do